ncbi:hypothetical protein IDH50_16280 [Aeromicrobium tamlense]|uniref:Bacterial Ig-like domain-containing protein n=1 Tax=Aeromicrobium tamlense TaxID=375541 RepID=A0A8I0G2Q7_9ACTN|nr:hypothetical protein [Aeromicrobium tamlense]MBD1271804.1 hypothetical protein [Aeromicrobium tamlense]NYI39008.1 hypothetical protein [Aeromicrobium tamlense]
MSPQTLVRGRRLLAGTTAAALSAGVLALTPTTAQAADDVVAPTLQWKISDQFAAHFTPNPAFSPFTTLEAADGATIDPTTKVTTFGGGVGTFDSGNGATSVAYEGSITGSFITGTTAPGTLQYSLTIADPTVTVNAAGEGKITADVAWNVPTATTTTGSTDDVTVVEFDATASDWSTDGSVASLTETPDFLGVLQPGSAEALDLGLPAGRPTDGGSFHPDFLRALDSGLRAHFFLSGSASGDPRKPASPFTATAPRPRVTVDSRAGATVKVSGTGFTCLTNTGDAGIYVGVAPSGELPDVSSPTGTANFVGVAAKFCFPPTPSISGPAGTWDATLNLDLDQVTPGTSYSVYTWRAHTHSTTSQDTETPLGVLKEKAVAPAVTVKSLSTKYGKGGTVGVTSPTAGSVTVAGLGTKTVAARGTASFAISKRHAVGTKSYRVTFAPSDTAVTAPAATAVTVKVAKTAASKGRVKVTRKPTSKKKGLAVVSVKGASGAAAPTGKVKIKLTQGKRSKYVTANLSAGKRTVKLPKLAKGTWVVRVAYYGNANYTKRGYVKAGSLKVAK